MQNSRHRLDDLFSEVEQGLSWYTSQWHIKVVKALSYWKNNLVNYLSWEDDKKKADVTSDDDAPVADTEEVVRKGQYDVSVELKASVAVQKDEAALKADTNVVVHAEK